MQHQHASEAYITTTGWPLEQFPAWKHGRMLEVARTPDMALIVEREYELRLGSPSAPAVDARSVASGGVTDASKKQH